MELFKYKLINRIRLIIFLVSFALKSFGQDQNESLADSIIINSDMTSYSKLIFINNCNHAEKIAEIDLKKGHVYILLSGGIAPKVYSNDSIFEKKYNIQFYDYGCVAAQKECIVHYNRIVFNSLKKQYGKKWEKEIRKDAIGLKKWKKYN